MHFIYRITFTQNIDFLTADKVLFSITIFFEIPRAFQACTIGLLRFKTHRNEKVDFRQVYVLYLLMKLLLN